MYRSFYKYERLPAEETQESSCLLPLLQSVLISYKKNYTIQVWFLLVALKMKRSWHRKRQQVNLILLIKKNLCGSDRISVKEKLTLKNWFTVVHGKRTTHRIPATSVDTLTTSTTTLPPNSILKLSTTGARIKPFRNRSAILFPAAAETWRNNASKVQ